ncbi:MULTISPECIES: rhomboid family intramembrane serine protease [Streptococcus]|jgi:S54 family peptidase|uniref:rhomboid family intramembrane serine protease n=1 Tax=Streptococcus TaxID=1301 RepID=UPI000A0F8162|nr:MULTISPECIES: rhomboid family intramembrane serine protease [Streptococcus]NMD84124.1 rhomboid family intramembrane serine protease [Streptococcus sp. WB01_FAA12]ORO83767.1 rhomboid family intramembrane serine protease [Streptococcus oralis subsp. dentisani]
MKSILKTYPVVSTLTFICLFLGILTSIYGNAMYDLLAFHSKPVYYWQYMSGTLMHGSKGAPLWFLWVHLFLNGLMILPFGGLLERKRGSKHVLVIFVTATVVSSIAFHLLTLGQKIQATGISAVGYAFITGGVMLLLNIWKEFSCTVKLFYLFLILLSSLMLLPMITGWISTFLHLSGIASYLLLLSSATALRKMLKASVDSS